MSEYKQFIYVGLTLLTFIFMFRWDMEPDGVENGVSHKLDRWTGTVYLCTFYDCTATGSIQR
jgi:hypothetical protein